MSDFDFRDRHVHVITPANPEYIAKLDFRGSSLLRGFRSHFLPVKLLLPSRRLISSSRRGAGARR